MSAEPAAILRVRSGAVLERVLERVVAALAARADLPVDRVEEAQIVAGAIAGGARRHAVDGVVQVTMRVEPGRMDLAVGPLEAGSAERVVAESAVPGVGVVLERLTDGWRVEAMDDRQERLDIEIRGGAGAGGR